MTVEQRAYYQQAADYSGCVTTAQNETMGLTLEHYQQWYLSRSEAYYRIKEAWARKPRGVWAQVAQTANGLKLLARRCGRLYILRKTNNTKRLLNSTLEIERLGVRNRYEGGKRSAADKALFLAMELRRTANMLCDDAPILREVRAGLLFDGGSEKLNPDFNYRTNELLTGKRLALIELFHQLLTEFDSTVLQPDSNKVVTATMDGLLIGYTEECLTKILVSIGLLVDAKTRAHTEESKPRTWRAVVEALRQRKYLEPGGDAVALWKALNKAYGPASGQLPSKRNLQDPMLERNSDAKLAFSRAYALLPHKG